MVVPRVLNFPPFQFPCINFVIIPVSPLSINLHRSTSRMSQPSAHRSGQHSGEISQVSQ